MVVRCLLNQQVKLNMLTPAMVSLRCIAKHTAGLTSNSDYQHRPRRSHFSFPSSNFVRFAMILTLFGAHFLVATYAAPIPRREPAVGKADKSHALSTGDVLTLLGVCVAVFGVALTLVLKWHSLRWLCTPGRRRHRLHSYLRSNSTF
jgi:hypothetical protein